ncbi:hypothetical protein O181_006246 [Austropuccinia psidii MF-1]|uniref:Uncharacterized protein n=1 Tax=Austropuccinia psidii MF-1 TaxID=1389203 RepID=A0A9Q3BIT9_9BASI|nr:hypothetical protein [Austropuccinia psidii MF-1]
MSSCKPHKSRSSSVHDPDREYSIEYVQTQSPMSPNISLTTPITSSMNGSGLNIDNPTNTKMNVSDGHTPEISSKPTLNISLGSQVHVDNEKRVDREQQKRQLENVTWSGLLEGNPGLMLHQNMAPKGKEVQSHEPIKVVSDKMFASLPLVHKEKVTGNNHPYCFKPRTDHASSSREKTVDYEDKNISPNHSETNDDQGGTISWHMRRALSQMLSSPTLKCHSPRVFLGNPRLDSKGTRLTKLTMWQNVQARRSNKDG